MSSKLIVAGLGLLVLVGCSSISVNSDFDPTTDFTSYKTYNWAPYAAGEVPGPADKRIMIAFDEEMAAKGMEKVESGGDMILRYAAGIKDKIYVDNMRYGYGWGTTDVYQYEQGTLVLEMIDPEKKEIFWRGTAKAAVDSSSPNPEKVKSAANLILARYPPS